MLFSEFISEGIIVSFDFDDTLRINAEDVFGKNFPRKKYISKLMDHLSNGDSVIIVTSRDDTPENKNDIQQFLSSEKIPNLEINFTDGDFKATTLKDLDVSLHYDDDEEELEALKRLGIKYIDTDDGELKSFYKKYFDKLNED